MIQVDVLLFPVLWLALAPFALRYVTARDGAHFNRRYDGLNNHTIQAEKNNSNSDSNNPKVKVELIKGLSTSSWYYTRIKDFHPFTVYILVYPQMCSVLI